MASMRELVRGDVLGLVCDTKHATNPTDEFTEAECKLAGSDQKQFDDKMENLQNKG